MNLERKPHGACSGQHDADITIAQNKVVAMKSVESPRAREHNMLTVFEKQIECWYFGNTLPPKPDVIRAVSDCHDTLSDKYTVTWLGFRWEAATHTQRSALRVAMYMCLICTGFGSDTLLK